VGRDPHTLPVAASRLGNQGATSKIPLKDYLDRWLAEVVSIRNKPRTHDSYHDMVRLHIAPAIGHVRLDKLQPEHVQQMLTALSAQGLSARTVQYARAILRRALNQAIRWRLLSVNVAVLVDAPRKEPHKIWPLTREQAQSLLTVIKGHRYELVYRVALSLGLRRGEVLALWRQDIDFDRGTVTIAASLQRIRKKLTRTTTKTDRVRVLPLPQSLLDALRAVRTRAKYTADTDYVFISTHGTPIEPRNLTRHFDDEVIPDAKLPEHTRFHDLRHSCATLLLAQGVPQRVIMEILGHTTISTTANIYTHVLPDLNREALDKIDGLLTVTSK